MGLGAVVLDVGAQAFGEGGQAVAVPVLEEVAGEGAAGVQALVGDLVHEMGVVGPAGGDGGVDVPHVLVVVPADDSIEPVPQLAAQLDIRAAGRVPRARQITESGLAVGLPGSCSRRYLQLLVGGLDEQARLRERAAPSEPGRPRRSRRV
jgi:hypothetical protein